MKVLKQVAEFHETFQHPILDTPQVPFYSRAELRKRLLKEELEEFIEAVDKKDLIGAADALCDLQYVLSGAVLEFGLKDVFEKMFDEVHRSNMSKACSNEEETQASILSYLQNGTPAHFEKRGEKYLIYRTSDNKTLKPINYSPANLKQFIENGEKEPAQS